MNPRLPGGLDTPLADMWRSAPIGELPPYLPQDNGCRLEAGLLKMQARALQTLLKMKFPAFASHILYNTQLESFLDTYLNYAPRPYEAAIDRRIGTSDRFESSLQGVEAVRTALHRSVLLAYLRFFTSHGEQQQVPSFATLASQSHVMNIPRALDLCNLYGFTDAGLLARLLLGAIAFVESGLLSQLEDACRSVSEILSDLEEAVASGSGDGETQDALEYLTDVTGGLSRLVLAVPLTSLGLASTPRLFGGLGRIYDVLIARFEAEGETRGCSSNGERACKYAGFACGCARALVGGVVAGLLALARTREGALEALFTFISELIQTTDADEEADEGGQGMGRLVRDCAGGLLSRLQAFLSAPADEQRPAPDMSGVSYLIELLRSTTGGYEAPTPRTGLFIKEPRAGRGAEGERRVQRPARSVEAMVQEVRQVCPGLGEGFVHACLAVMGYNINMVVNALLEGSALPYPLDTLDRSLPSPLGADKLRKKGGEEAEEARDEEFIARQKAYLRQMEKDAEEDAYLLQEYDDDFDDQYSGEQTMFSRDNTREDFEAIRKYNNLMRKEEEEEHFWEGMQLKQPELPTIARDSEDDDKDSRGRTKEPKSSSQTVLSGSGSFSINAREKSRVRGTSGSLLSRGESAAQGRGEDGATSHPMSALARRRKEKQKHLRANHNRKVKAVRKSGVNL